LITLLESSAIKKVVTKISAGRSKLAEVGITLNGEIHLQKLAKERGVVDRMTVGLEAIFGASFPGVHMQKDFNARLSDWSRTELDDSQMEYAALDAYSQMICYLKLRSIPFIDTTEKRRPKTARLSTGDKLLLYTANLSSVVAEGTFLQPTEFNLFKDVPSRSATSAQIQINFVRRPGAKVRQMSNVSFEDLIEEARPGNSFEVKWLPGHTRLAPDTVRTFDATLNTK
jgi:hypothetical protein